MNDDGYVFNYFTYYPLSNTVRIDISEYEYPKEEFDLTCELSDFIHELNRLYCKCDDDRMRCDSDANTEFYTREAVQNIPKTKLLLLESSLKYVTTDEEKLKVEYQIEVLKEVVDEINRLLD